MTGCGDSLAVMIAARLLFERVLGLTTSALIALDPQEDCIAGNETALRRLIGLTDIFMPSAEEVRQLLGHTDWEVAARTFADWGSGDRRAETRLRGLPSLPEGW